MQFVTPFSRMMMLAALFAALSFAVTPIYAQTPSATLYGSVHDQSGAVIAGSGVELLSEESGIHRSVQSNTDGQFVMPLLSNGRYTLTASRAGFKTEVIRNIPLEVGQKAKVDVLLAAGSIEEHVEVVADLNTLQPVNSTVGEVIDHRL